MADRVLVTGGAGFIGSNLVRWLLRHTDVEVRVFDALTYAGNLANLAEVETDPRYGFVRGDVCDADAVADAMAGCDVVVHLAAETHVDRSIAGGQRFVETNCVGTGVVCEAALRQEVSRLVHISTDEVYGSVPEGSSLETDPLRPRSPYSASKAGSDLIASSYHVTHGLPVVVTRCCNNYGPYQYPEKVIPLFVTNLIDGKRVPLYGDGLNIRDWLHVEDNCAAIHTVVERGVVGEIYNIAAGNELTNRDLTMLLLERCGRGADAIEHVEDRLGHDRRYSVDSSKIEALGWRPRWSLADGLDATVAWYRDNERWWRPLT